MLIFFERAVPISPNAWQVPFRDQPAQNRARHLEAFLRYMPGYLGAAVAGADGARAAAAAAVFVVEQNGRHPKFNRGLLLNAAVELAAAEGYNSPGRDCH